MNERPSEQEAVKTTIVGGRPPGSGKPVGPIPRGIEVLVKKAAIDADFKQMLLERRAGAADEIGLKLEPSEVAMLNAVPEAQLQAIIARTTVHPRLRPAFLGRVAAVMIVALGASTTGCKDRNAPLTEEGIRPDRPEQVGQEGDEDSEQPDHIPATRGIDPDRPEKGDQQAGSGSQDAGFDSLLRSMGHLADRPDSAGSTELWSGEDSGSGRGGEQ